MHADRIEFNRLMNAFFEQELEMEDAHVFIKVPTELIEFLTRDPAPTISSDEYLEFAGLLGDAVLLALPAARMARSTWR